MITNYAGGKIDLGEGGGEMVALQRRGSYEWRKVNAMYWDLRPGQTFIDAGAFNGYFTLIAARLVGARGDVLAFEPDEENFKRLGDNIILNRYYNVTAFCAALSNHAGEAVLHKRDHKGWGTLLPIDTPGLTVPLNRLDDLTERADMVKIDVEGAEADVLEGMERLFFQVRQMTLLLDLHPELGVEPGRVQTILKHHGFSLYDIRSGMVPISNIPLTLVELMARRDHA